MSRGPASTAPVRGRLARAAAGALLALVLGATAFGADEDKVIFPGAARTEEPAKSAAPSFNSASLVIGIALAAVGGWMVFRHRRGVPMGRDQRALSVDETRSLGNRQYLVVASYEGKKFLIGVCPGRIDMLAPLDGSAPGARRAE